MNKPLGHKAYGSIGHLPQSRLGPSDHSVHDGQAKICLEKVRDKHDIVIVQEKLDGSCVAVANIDGMILPLGRSGWPAQTSPYRQHQMFAEWVYKNQSRFEFLNEGERLCGEWLVQAHGTKYELPHEPFVAFDIMRIHERNLYQDFLQRVLKYDFVVPRLISYGLPLNLKELKKRLEPSGHGAIDPVEGAVFRVERKEKVDFLAKWVYAGKEDGLYLPEKGNQDTIVWNTWND